MLSNYGSMTLAVIAKPQYWTVLNILVERPATIDQLVKKTGYKRNEILAITKHLDALSLIHRPRSRGREGLTGLVVVAEPEKLEMLIDALEDWFCTIWGKVADKAAREAEMWQRFADGKFPRPDPAWYPQVIDGGRQ